VPLLAEAGLPVPEETGIRFDPLGDSFERSSDLGINYAMLAVRPQTA